MVKTREGEKKALEKAEYCTKEIPKAKTDYYFTLTNKLPTYLLVACKFISNFSAKSWLLNYSFASISAPTTNVSALPSSLCNKNSRIKMIYCK